MNSVKQRPNYGSLVLLLTVFVLARVLFIVFMPHFYSKDLYAWLHVMELLSQGKNPYTDSGVLNWPPFWMQILFGIHKVSEHTSIPIITLIQIVLIGAEVAALIVTYWILKIFFNFEHATKLLVITWALNPIAIILTCQHCNFDVFVGLWILLSIAMILKFFKDQSLINLLIACFFMGLGILTKTVPLILAPLVLSTFRNQNINTKLFGLVLLLTPVVLGMSIIYTLAPVGVKQDVIGYRSIAGWYGITGILSLFEMYKTADFYSSISPLIFLLLMLLTARYAFKNYLLKPEQYIKLNLLLLISIPTLGPGYSPPYILWYLPLLIILFAISSPGSRSFLIVGYVIIAITYLIEYALFEDHGAFLTKLIPDTSLIHLGQVLGGHSQSVLMRLPMFMWYIILFVKLIPNNKNRQLRSFLKNELN